MALRKRLKIEDAVLGAFIVLALLYPLIITVLIEMEEPPEGTEGRKILRSVYLILLGLERCEAGNVIEVAKRMDRKLLKDLGGVEGLLRVCRENSGRFGRDIRIEEKFSEEDHYRVLRVRVVGRDEIELRIYGYEDGGNFKIVGIEHVKGS